VSHFAPLHTPSLPESTKRVIDDFLQVARSAFGENLRAAVLYGSAAEGKLRPTSDTNLILILTAFEQTQVDGVRQSLRLAQSAIQLKTMFLLQEEIPLAVRSFAPKFADVIRRRVVLFGEDPFAAVTIPRDAEIRQLRQQLLNLMLRLRSAYAERGLREEQLGIFLANIVGALRSLAQTLCELQGRPARSAREAFAQLGDELGLSEWSAVLSAIERIQSGQLSEAGKIPRVYMQVLECLQRMRTKAERIDGAAQ